MDGFYSQLGSKFFSFRVRTSGKGSTLKGKKYAPLGSKFFPFRVGPFSESLLRRKANRKSQNCLPFIKNGRKSIKCIKCFQRKECAHPDFFPFRVDQFVKSFTFTRKASFSTADTKTLSIFFFFFCYFCLISHFIW